jgi:hypothetical protein
MEVSMQRATLAVLASAAAFGLLATTGVSAMPISPPAAASPKVQIQANRVCNAEGWCWFLPHNYRPYSGYRYYRYDDYYPFWPKGFDRSRGYGAWHRRWEDDHER